MVFRASLVDQAVHRLVKARFVTGLVIAAHVEWAVCLEAKTFQRFCQVADLGVAASFGLTVSTD